jgi:hypothetical protein
MGAYQHKKSMLKKLTKLTSCTPPFCTLEQVLKNSLAEMTQKRWGLIKCLQNSCSNFTQHEAYVHVIQLSIPFDINYGVDYVAGVRAHGRSPFECKERRQRTWTALSFPPDGFSMSTWLVL